MNKQSGRGLVGILISIALMIGLTVVYLKGGMGIGGVDLKEREDGKGETVIGQSMYAAKDTVCQSNMRQIRMSIATLTDPVSEQFPSSLQELRLGSEYESCPVGEVAYVYDPRTGQVSCPHTGHSSH
jgi:hypothetical protein